MIIKHFAIGLAAMTALAGCVTDTTRDFGLDAVPLSELQSAIWIDPNGCEHWIIDDGVEGYMSPRVRPDGTPVCRDTTPTENTVGFERRLIGAN